MKKINILFVLIFSWVTAQTQQRYLDPVFDDVTITYDQVYGVNATALYFLVLGEAVPQQLLYDFYEPTGDTETERPLVLLFHSGTFLPFPLNTLSNGTMRDSAVVDIATKLAKMGYVVASCDYRLGWRPDADTQDERVFGIMNAAYRAIQDARTAIRYFKKTVAENENPHKIDETRIVLWGVGTGGYISMGCASLDDWATEIAMLGKFNIDVGGMPVPVVVPAINGDIHGTSVGIAPPGYPFPQGDTLCYPNHVGYSSDFQMAVNMGGAIGDTTWVDENTLPCVSLHVPTDEVTPYKTAIVTLPEEQGSLAVVEVSGSYDFQKMQKKFNNNQDWEIDWSDKLSWDVTAVADSRNDGLEGLFPVLTDSVENNAPWDWWATDIEDQFGPADPITAKATIDSAIAYFAPRVCITLVLGCEISSLNEIEAAEIDLKISPNPANNHVFFQAKEFPIEHIYVYDLQGRLVKVHSDINNFNFNMPRNSLEDGVYIAQVRFKHGFISKQIVFYR